MARKANQDIRIRFGLAVKKRRAELGLSQEKLAEAADLHRTYVADIERGTRNVALVSIEKLARGLRLPIGRLFGDYGVDR